MLNLQFDENSAKKANAGVQGLGKVLDSGVYDVELQTVSVTTASTGTIGLDFSFKVDGAQYPNTIYGVWIQKANGDKLFSYDIVQALMGLLGVTKTTTYQKEIEIKDGTKIVEAIKEFDNRKVKIAVQKVLDCYNGEVKEKNEIKRALS